MKKNTVKFLLLILSLIMVISVSACGGNEGEGGDEPTAQPTEAPNPGTPTVQPGNDLALKIEGPASFKKGDEVKYTISLEECNIETGLIGIDYTVKFDAEALSFVGDEQTEAPHEKWESLSREGSDAGIRIYTCIDDSDSMDHPAKSKGDYVLNITFKAEKDSTEGQEIISLIDVTGTVFNDNLDMAYGRGNSI